VGYAHPTEPQCSYDPVEGLSLAPDTDPLEKIKQLETEISQLKDRLVLQQQHQHPPTTARGSTSSPLSQQASTASPSLSPSFRTATSSSSSPSSDSAVAGPSSIKLPSTPMALMNLISPESPETLIRRKQEFEQIQNISLRGKDSQRYMDLLVRGWNPDLPEPATLNHYIETFFRCDPCAFHVLHRPSLLAALSFPPKDSRFPHSAILHAICACASRWSPTTQTSLSGDTRRDEFAEFHAGKTRQYIDKTMASGDDIFPVMQACTLLSWFFFHEGRWVEVWVFAGFQTRVAIPLRLNNPGTLAPNNMSEGQYLAPPKSALELEGRRRTWWMTVMFDRIVSMGGWVHAVDERDIGTEFPVTNLDYENGAEVPSNPQDIITTNVFTIHPPEYTDSYLLLLKAVILFGRVTEFNVRNNLRQKTAPHRTTNPFLLPGFEELDSLVSSRFLGSLPGHYRMHKGVGDVLGLNSLDTDLYMVHILPHAATITLHNPYIEFTDPDCLSTQRCVRAAKAILDAYYSLSTTSLDISRLHPLVTICWYLAAAVQVQLCKYFIELGDSANESTVWGEINVLRFAMLEFGSRSPIGCRQERLLQGLMREIVRMTSQEQPLQVGVPLYPFSRTTLWRKEENTTNTNASPDACSGGMQQDGDHVDEELTIRTVGTEQDYQSQTQDTTGILMDGRGVSPSTSLAVHSPGTTLAGSCPGSIPVSGARHEPYQYPNVASPQHQHNGYTHAQPMDMYHSQADHQTHHDPSSSLHPQPHQAHLAPHHQQNHYSTAGYPSYNGGGYGYGCSPAATLVGSGSSSMGTPYDDGAAGMGTDATYAGAGHMVGMKDRADTEERWSLNR
jgi:hypothetical protein